MDARDHSRRRADLARILDVDPTPRPLRVSGTLALAALVVLGTALLVAAAAQTRDDVRATRARVDAVRPCGGGQ